MIIIIHFSYPSLYVGQARIGSGECWYISHKLMRLKEYIGVLILIDYAYEEKKP